MVPIGDSGRSVQKFDAAFADVRIATRRLLIDLIVTADF
jgi:hypothetical protein